jgi:hypothetical protein
MPQFAAWVAQHNEPSLTYALARLSTPPEVVQAVVEADEPPTLQQVKAMKRAAAEQGADAAAPSVEPQPAPPPALPLRERLERLVSELRAVLRNHLYPTHSRIDKSTAAYYSFIKACA